MFDSSIYIIYWVSFIITTDDSSCFLEWGGEKPPTSYDIIHWKYNGGSPTIMDFYNGIDDHNHIHFFDHGTEYGGMFSPQGKIKDSRSYILMMALATIYGDTMDIQ